MIPNTTPIREGFHFLGWAESESATEATYLPGDTITFGRRNGIATRKAIIADTRASESASLTLYAIWTKKCVLTFDMNGGTGSIESQGCNATASTEEPCEVTIPGSVPTREGYEFKGWAETRTAETAGYKPGDSLTLTEDKVLYAVWENKMPVPDAGDDEPKPTPKPDGTPSKPDTGRMTGEDNNSNIINTIAIFILVPSIIALSGYMFKRYNDKKNIKFENNR
jgi:uncharacterized repeat protein (TIGR02543 family)